ncbi:MAG: pyrroline-5-carboxylate reductase [Anaerosomatales bacterium]|nr:pyrroline-5-carboxylate reductase [Anaerosomatales bacterium]
MADERTIAIIGGGRMGEAIVAGLISAGAADAASIVVAEPDPARHAVFEAHGVRCVRDGHDAVQDAEIVILAVKPQVIDAVLAHLAEDVPAGARVVSIAAGVRCARLEALLEDGVAVIRVMPNTPALVGAGMSVVSGGTHASPEQVEEIRALFEALGSAIVLDERYQDAATAISGSGPAYVALFIDALARAGVRQGLSRDVAQQLATQTLRGTVELLERTGKHPEELVDAVSSPGGTTIAAIEALEKKGFRASVAEAVEAAVRRARELGS